MEQNAYRDGSDTGQPDANQPDAYHSDACWRCRVSTLCAGPCPAGPARLGLLRRRGASQAPRRRPSRRPAPCHRRLQWHPGLPVLRGRRVRLGRLVGQPGPHLQTGPLGLGAQDGGERLTDVLHLLHLHQVGKAVGALQGRS